MAPPHLTGRPVTGDVAGAAAGVEMAQDTPTEPYEKEFVVAGQNGEPDR